MCSERTPAPPARGRMTVRFPGGKRVHAAAGGFEIRTDQPETAGGAGTAPAPFDLFLASLATCAGYYVLEFCRGRGIPPDGLRLDQHVERDPASRRVTAIHQEIHVPSGFPARYADAVARAAASCPVKKHLTRPPRVEARVVGWDG